MRHGAFYGWTNQGPQFTPEFVWVLKDRRIYDIRASGRTDFYVILKALRLKYGEPGQTNYWGHEGWFWKNGDHTLIFENNDLTYRDEALYKQAEEERMADEDRTAQNLSGKL